MANRALKGIGFGLIIQVGRVGEQRIPLLKRLICAHEDHVTESQLKQQDLQAARRCLDKWEVLVHDAGASIRDMQTAGIERYIVRLARNCTARHNELPPRKPKGRAPEYGKLVRPLSRTWKDRTIPATAPEMETHFDFEGRVIQVKGWQDVVRSDQKVAAENETYTIWMFVDPLYQDPLILGTNVVAKPRIIFCLYLDRWPVEQVPLVAKQLLGLERQFAFARASRHRLPGLALLAANILTYLAAVLLPIATGFWDRQPKRTPGRLRRVLAKLGFPKDYPLDGRLRKKGLSPSTYPRE